MQDSWEKMEEEFSSSGAKKQGVKLPKKVSQKGQTLYYLWENKENVIKKSQAELEICCRLGIQTKDIQSLRHLGKQSGFNVLQKGARYGNYTLKKGEYVFVGFEEVNKYWNINRRNDKELDFFSIKKKFNNKCATCGEKEGQPHRYTGSRTKLEKGHMDPSKSMKNENIIPQCSFCNGIYKDKFIFGNTGFVKQPTKQGILDTVAKMNREEVEELIKKMNKYV
jgi:hypothetical protein